MDSGVTALERHANRYDGLTWCEAREDWSADDDGVRVEGDREPVELLDSVPCVECICRIVAYGELAARRLLAVDQATRRGQGSRSG